MILGILLGLLSVMLMISLAISTFMFIKYKELSIKLQMNDSQVYINLDSIKSQLSIFNMFKEQTLAKMIQLENTLAFSQPKEGDITGNDEIRKINEEQFKAFEEEYLKALEERSL